MNDAALNPSVLTIAGEAKLRRAFALLKSWATTGLIARLLETDIAVASENAALVLISHGMSSGMLQRCGKHGSRIYRINPAWKTRPASLTVAIGTPAPSKREKQDGRALAVALPTHHRGELVASLGLRSALGTDADGELLPCIGGRIVDVLHGQFRSMFAGAE
jgi:hypothetical protein